VNKLSDVNSTYEDIEQLAVRTGIAPRGKGSKNFDAGTWTSIGDGVYMRCFPEGYAKSNVEIFIPEAVKISGDNGGNVVSFDNGTFKIEMNYEAGSDKFKTAVVKNIFTSEEVSVENTVSDAMKMKQIISSAL
jgi:hypothetical protein